MGRRGVDEDVGGGGGLIRSGAKYENGGLNMGVHSFEADLNTRIGDSLEAGLTTRMGGGQVDEGRGGGAH